MQGRRLRAGRGAPTVLGSAGALGEDDAAPAFLAGRPRRHVGGRTRSARRKARRRRQRRSLELRRRRHKRLAPTAPTAAVLPGRAGGSDGSPRPDSPRLGEPAAPGDLPPSPQPRGAPAHNQPLLFVAIGMALVMASLVLFPIIINSRGGRLGRSAVVIGIWIGSRCRPPTARPAHHRPAPSTELPRLHRQEDGR